MSLIQFYSNLNKLGASSSPAPVSKIIKSGTFTIASSIDPTITGMYSKYAYEEGLTNMPVLVIMHGYIGDADSFEGTTYMRLARYGFFVLGVSTRAEKGAGGSKDSSGRELQDIIDSVEYTKTNFSGKINTNNIVVSGYSGGGGNVYGLLSKFPTYFNMYIANFGMSDYGYEADGWYQTNPNYQTQLQNNIGGTPTAKPNEYRSRNHRESINNFGLLNPLYIFHDTEDTLVSVVHGQKIDTALGINVNKNYHESTIGDAERWDHGYPTDASTIAVSEKYWKDNVAALQKKVVPDSATIKVMGFIVTSKFTIWLGDGTASKDGTNRSALVTYNVANSTYDVTPLLETGATDCTVKVTQGTKSVTATISNQTVLTAI